MTRPLCSARSPIAAPACSSTSRKSSGSLAVERPALNDSVAAVVSTISSTEATMRPSRACCAGASGVSSASS